MSQYSEAWYRGYNDYFNDVNVCIDYPPNSPDALDWYNGWREAKDEIENHGDYDGAY